MQKTVAKVVQKEESPVEVTVLAEAIVKLGTVADKLLSTGLKKETIVLLLHDHSGVGKPAIRAVLSSMTQLKAAYTTK